LPGPLSVTITDAAPVRSTRMLRLALLDAAILAACIAAAAGLSLALGQDANWDLQNYHYYIPWAWTHGKRAYTTDVVAAQLQTYHNPLPDLPFYAMVTADWAPATIAMVMAIPAGIGAFFLWKLLTCVVRNGSRAERWTALACAFLIGTTSGVGFGVLGTTMNEWPGTALTMAALYVLVHSLVRGEVTTRSLVVAGLLAGCATGVKLTYGVFAVGMCAALLVSSPLLRAALRNACTFGLSVLVGTALSAGGWMWSLWEHFGNPIFPYANKWIKSPWWGQYEVMNRPFGPKTLAEWVVFPFSMTAPQPFFVTEMGYVDGRVAAVYGLSIVALVAALLAPRREGAWRMARQWRFLVTFAVVSFVLWTAQYSIVRYLLPLLLLSGAFVVALLARLVQPGVRIPAFVMSALLLITTTTMPDWWRIEFGTRWFEVELPKLDRDPLVLLTSDAPMSYVLPFFPDDAKFLGVHNNISDARRQTLMEETIRKRIRDHEGPLYALSYPAGSGVDALLERKILKVTETCVPVVTNMRTSPLELCRVVQFR
jgi:hypothetical protein